MRRKGLSNKILNLIVAYSRAGTERYERDLARLQEKVDTATPGVVVEAATAPHRFR